jgi:hypothetical protein
VRCLVRWSSILAALARRLIFDEGELEAIASGVEYEPGMMVVDAVSLGMPPLTRCAPPEIRSTLQQGSAEVRSVLPKSCACRLQATTVLLH